MNFLQRLFGKKIIVDNNDLLINVKGDQIIGCTKCKCLFFEHDDYFCEYICLACGWATSTVPNGVDKKTIIEKYSEPKNKQDELVQQENISDKLQMGMSLNEINRILGPSTASMGGDEVISITKHTGATMHGSPEKMMGGKTFMQWDRPEGTYKLVIENNKLARIFSKPEKKVKKVDVSIRVEKNKPSVREKILDSAGPLCIRLSEPKEIISLGEVAVPEIVDIFKNVRSANQALLTIALEHFASNGNVLAEKTLSAIAEGKIQIDPWSYGDSALEIAQDYMAEKRSASLQSQTPGMTPGTNNKSTIKKNKDGTFYSASLAGLSNESESIFLLLSELPILDDNQTDRFKNKWNITKEGEGNEIISNLIELIKKRDVLIRKHVDGISSLDVSCQFHSDPYKSVGVTIWRRFQNGNTDGIQHQIVRVSKDHFMYGTVE